MKLNVVVKQQIRRERFATWLHSFSLTFVINKKQMYMEINCQCCTHTRTQSGHSQQSEYSEYSRHPKHSVHIHESQPGIRLLVLSATLLFSGILFQHVDVAWFRYRYIEIGWFFIAYLLVGWSVIQEAWKNLLQKDFFNEFTLMTLASVGAFCIGEYPEGVAVMLFYSSGEMLQHKAVARATRNIRQLLDVRPEQVRVWRGGRYQNVSPRRVEPGEIIEIKPGERVPLDGLLQAPQAVFDTSALTGESMPRTIMKEGDILAGMIVQSQAVRIQVTKPYDQSTLARILSLVQEASERKAPAELFMRRFARIYTPTVTLGAFLVIVFPALAAIFIPSFHYVFSEWLYRGLVFLVISCPCALVISIPLGYFGGIGAASKAGILFKGGNYLDAITRVETVVFDKTGTLTTGRFEVSAIHTQAIPSAELMRLLASVEQKSTHPVAQAIVRYARQAGIKASENVQVCERAGFGLEGQVDGKEILVGPLRLLIAGNIPIPSNLPDFTSTGVFCAVDGQYAGYIALSDTLKEDAQEAVSRLKALYIRRIQLLSGDKKEIVRIFADKVGIDQAYGDLLPEDKTDHLKRLQSETHAPVAFVGDGMNDAPVLALSNVGIAMGGLGSDAAIESADVVIQTDQPSKVATAISIGRATRRIVTQNIIGAIGVKGLILLAGACGYATLWGAVFADVGVAILAVLNSVRILHKSFK